MKQNKTLEEIKKEKRLYELFEKMDISILADISEYLYEHASPYGEINTPVGKWVFVNPMNKQWYSKEELQSTISQTKQDKDYVVVESQEVANDLIKNYKGKSLQRKWVVVAPKGIKEVSIDELLKLPQIKEIVSQTKQELIEECICNEWDGKGISTCGFPCPVHNKNFKNNKIHKEGFDAGYKKGYKDGLKNVSGWSKEYEKMMLENL